MAVHPHRATWTDERLDDLNHSIRDGFARYDREHQEFREEMRTFRFEVNKRFDSLQRIIIVGLSGMFATVLGGIVALIAGA